MALESGVFKQLAYKAESTYGAAPGQASGQSLRRVQSTLDLAKETYQSQEIRPDLQVADFRHGVRSVQGSINGDLSAKTYADFFAAAVRRDFAAVTAITGLTLTIAGAGPTYTVTRAAGDFVTDGVKVGMVVRLSGGTLNAANINTNLMVVSLTTTALTVIVLNGGAMVAQSAIATTTVTPVGKRTFVPSSGHTDKSFAIEHWYPNAPASELFLGCKVSKIGLQLPPTGLAQIALDVMGQDVADTTAKRSAVALGSQYYTAPTAVTSTGSLASVNGVLRVAGATIATVTGLSLDINSAYTSDAVVGSNVKPNMFPGRVTVSGQLTAYFDSTALRDTFWQETEIDLMGAFTASNAGTADFLAFYCPRIKVSGAAKDDGEKGIVQTLPFTALLYQGAGVGVDLTTLALQDSAA